MKQPSSILNNPKEKSSLFAKIPFLVNEENQKLKREKCKPPLNQLRIQSVDTFLKKLFQSNSVQGHLLRYCFIWTKQGHINHTLEFSHYISI